MDVLIFELDGVRYAIPAAGVREVLPAVTIAPLPGSPPIVDGVINVRGRLIAVVNARARLGLPVKPLAPTEHLVLTDAGDRLVAVRIDRALGLTSIDDTRLAPRESLAGGAAYVGGIATLDDGLVLIHDVPAFLDTNERATLDAAMSWGPPSDGPGTMSRAVPDERTS